MLKMTNCFGWKCKIPMVFFNRGLFYIFFCKKIPPCRTMILFILFKKKNQTFLCDDELFWMKM